MMRTAACTAAAAMLLGALGCGGPGGGMGEAREVGEGAAGPTPQAAESGLAYSLPPGAPARFGFGTPASPARVAQWDIDVKPDGEGLPAGAGSVAQGRVVYQAHCVACHGPTGTEGPNDRLVGTEPWGQWPGTRGVGNYWPYATTLFDYIRRAMPQATPGVLTANETYAVIAYLLSLNDLIPADAVMNAEGLTAVAMPFRDKFVPDDREGGPVIR